MDSPVVAAHSPVVDSPVVVVQVPPVVARLGVVPIRLDSSSLLGVDCAKHYASVSHRTFSYGSSSSTNPGGYTVLSNARWYPLLRGSLACRTPWWSARRDLSRPVAAAWLSGGGFAAAQASHGGEFASAGK